MTPEELQKLQPSQTITIHFWHNVVEVEEPEPLSYFIIKGLVGDEMYGGCVNTKKRETLFAMVYGTLKKFLAPESKIISPHA